MRYIMAMIVRITQRISLWAVGWLIMNGYAEAHIVKPAEIERYEDDNTE